MAHPGSRTKTTDCWLLPEDEASVGQRIAELLPGAGWLCSQPGPLGLHQVHVHPSVQDALRCGGVQALLALPAGAAAPAGVQDLTGSATGPGRPSAVVQLLCSRRRQNRNGEVFDAGRLAVRWFEPEVGPEMHRLLTEQTRTVWRALRAATRPAPVETAAGHRISGMRIGRAAHAFATDTGIPLARGVSQYLRPTTTSTGNQPPGNRE
ncbi:hypothetical protein [Kitasatospora sp. NPDC088134]|uniref:hypothetical protein n=1 Tax=Kitasatospora sp. NPDC088134 TaxID=3364071 RepID=UPI00382CA18E